MKYRLLPFLLLIGVFSCSVADEKSPDDAIVSIGIGDIRNDSTSISGVHLVSTGQPDRQVLEIAKAAGFTTVVDMRTAAEDRGIDEAAEVEALGMRYLSLPVADGADVTYVNARELDRILAESNGPVLLHCASGNRVGALYALREKLHGATDEQAIESGRAAGLTRLEGVVKLRLQEE